MNCLDEGLLQALIDGELSAELRREAEAHLASCPACAAAATEAAQEFALFSQAFAVEERLNVPTERLRANIASAAAEMQPAPAFDGVAARASSDGRERPFWSSLVASLAPRQVAVFASLALVAVVLAATFLALRPGSRPDAGGGDASQIADGGKVQPPAPAINVNTPAVSNSMDGMGADSGRAGAGGGGIANNLPGPIKPAAAKNQPKGGPPQKIGPRTPLIGDRSAGQFAAAPPRPKTPRPDLLPVEREYVREIAALKSSIERQKLRTLSPTLRAEYERNVAVVDEAIASTRAAAKSNPADTDAREFLRAAYQNKLDLLTTVAGKSELAAAGR
jgi:hypothetical protein